MAELIPIPSVQRAPYAGAMVDVNAAQAPARALGAVAEGLGEVAGVVNEFGQRVKRAKDMADWVRAQNVMREEQAAFEAWTETQQDESRWAEENERRVAQARGKLGQLNLSRDMQGRIDAAFEDWAGQRRVQVTNQAARRTAENAHIELTTAIKQYADAGNMIGVEELIREGSTLGMWSDAEANAMRSKMNERAAIMQANRTITQDPTTALEMLNQRSDAGGWEFWGELDENMRRSLMVEARREIETLHSTTIRELMYRRGQGEVLRTDELQALVDSNRMTPQQMKNIMLEQRRSGDDQAVLVDVARVYQMADAYNPGHDPLLTQQLEIETAALSLPPRFRDRALRRLDRAINGDQGSGSAAVANDVFRQAYAAGAFGDTTKVGNTFLDQDAAARASRRMVELQDEMERWLELNPKASRVDVYDQAQAMLREQAAKPAVLDASPGEVMRDRQGNQYRYIGGVNGDRTDPANWEKVP